MLTYTIEGIYRNGLVEISENLKFKEPMKVLVIFIDETPMRTLKFSHQ